MLPPKALLLIFHVIFLAATGFLSSDIFVRGLSVVRHPFAVRQFHIGKNRPEGGVLRAAGVDAERNLSLCLIQVADTHLMERLAVL